MTADGERPPCRPRRPFRRHRGRRGLGLGRGWRVLGRGGEVGGGGAGGRRSSDGGVVPAGGVGCGRGGELNPCNLGHNQS